jgi:hypothetical protein
MDGDGPDVRPSALNLERLEPVRFRCNFRCSLVLAAVLVTTLYKARVVRFARPLDLFLACTVDALVWAWLFSATEFVLGRTKGTLRRGLSLAFFPLFYVLLACDLAHASFYDVATERRFSLFDVDLTSLGFFLRHVVSGRWLLAAGAFALVIHGAAWWLSSRNRGYPVRRSLLGLCAATVLVVTAATSAPRVPSPLFDTVRDAYDLVTLTQVVPRPSTRPERFLAALDKSATDSEVRAPAFTKILVFVMETVPTKDFESERSRLPAAAFFRAMDEHTHRYDRYYATNQDSRTGMLDMLGSRLVPYEAYTEYGLRHYTFLSRKSSLVPRFNELGYATVYAASHADREAVLRDMPWKRLLTLPEARVRAASSKYLCVTRYEFEHGCEDLALLPDVLAFIDGHERVFMLQEFIWGHDPEYNELSGRTNADYYSAYLDAVVAHLRATHVLDDTLIVLTSDHGYRSRSKLGQVSSYELPLLFFSTRFSPARSPELRSHLDFKDLLLFEAGARERPVATNPFVLNVGPTGAGTLAVVTENEQLLLFKTRENLAFVLDDHRRDGGAAGVAESPGVLLGAFREYRRRFDAFGQGGPSPAD